MNKKGVTLLVLAMAITVMVILISTATVIGSNSIITANFEEYKSRLNRVQNDINVYYLQEKELPVTNEIVNANSLGSEFVNSVNNHNDSLEELYVVDINKLNDPTIKLGKGTVKTKDVFLVSKKSQNVYYLKGFKYKSKVYFNYTDNY